MRYLCALVVYFLSFTVCSAQRFNFNQGCNTAKNYYEEIPYENINGKMLMSVEVNGKKRRFLFDTGAPVQISSALFKELNLTVANHGKVHDANGSVDSVSGVIIPSIKLNNTEFTQVPGLITDAPIYQCWQMDGVIGSNILRNSIVRIDPVKQVVIITDDEKRLYINRKKAATLIVDGTQSYPLFMLWLTGKKTIMVGFDSGEGDFLVMTEKDMAQCKKDVDFTRESIGFGAAKMSLLGLAKNDSINLLKFPVLGIDGYPLKDVYATTNKTTLTRVGTRLLDYGAVTLDFIHHYFYLDPYKPLDAGEKHWPIKPTIANNKMVVGIVWDKLQGQANPGDQIIAINDVPYPTVDLCEWINGKSNLLKDLQTATLTIKDAAGNIKKITMVKE